MFQMPLSLIKKKQLCQIILKSMHKIIFHVQLIVWTSSISAHFLILPSSVTLTFNLPEQMFQMALLLLKDNNCTTLFWNPCINVQVMTQKSSVYDIIWPSGMTLTFNLQEQMFQMALLLLKDNNNCAKLYWNPCINVQFMAQMSSIYDHFIIWPSGVTLTFNLPEQMFQMALLIKQQLCQIVLKSMHLCASYGLDKPEGCTIYAHMHKACTTHSHTPN